jgi:beta-lactamase class A
LFVAKYIYENGIDQSQAVNVGAHSDQISENNSDGISFVWGSSGENLPANIPMSEALDKMLTYSDNVSGATLKDWVNAHGASVDGGSSAHSANSIASLMAAVANRSFTGAAAMENILRGQYHRQKIPAGVPGAAIVANKTGELHGSNYSHDAAIIRSENGRVYVLVVMTHLDPDQSSTNSAIAGLSKDLYEIFK